jgi:hypothetical protein
MNAILALGASHLTRVAPGEDYTTQAIVHRGHAIEGLNKALNKTDRTYGESDAMLAACYALTFQASHMGDGMIDFITMVRGCALVTEKVKQEGSTTAFNIDRDAHIHIMNPRLDDLPEVDCDIVAGGISGLTQMQHLLDTYMEHQFHSALLNVLLSLQQSPRAGYVNFIYLYSIFYSGTHEQFAAFLNPNNLVIRVLLAYFISLQFIMTPLSTYEWPDRVEMEKPEALTGMIEWSDRIFESTPPDLLVYLQWPMEIVGTVRTEIAGHKVETSKILKGRSRSPT